MMTDESTEKAPSSQELLERIKAELARGTLQPERFTRLLYVIAHIEDQGSTTMSCQTCRENLDLIAVDELAGRDIFRQYPDLILHLISCQDCRAAYIILRETLRSEQDENTPLMISAPNPLLESTQAPWKRVEGPSANSLPLRFEVACDFITRALRGPQLALARGEEISEEDRTTLLLADFLQIEQSTYVVKASLYRRLDDPESIDLEVRLANEDPLPEELTVYLTWADIRRSTSIAGTETVYFRNLPLSELIDPQTGEIQADLALTFARD